MVAYTKERYPDFQHLKATNRSIATDSGFGNLYEIFNKRYRDPRERIEAILNRMQLSDLNETIKLSEKSATDVRSFNTLITLLSRRAFQIKSVADKQKLKDLIYELIKSDPSVYEARDFAISSGLIALSESNKVFVDRNNEKLKELSDDQIYQEFSQLRANGSNTKIRIKKWLKENTAKFLTDEIVEDRFEDLQRNCVELEFLEGLSSDELKFTEIQNFYAYENDEKSFSTMHKTKGTGIPKVLVVLHEYGLKKDYDFLSCFSGNPPKEKREVNARRLLYVACSRAIHDLICVRLVENAEEAQRIGAFFPKSHEIEL